MSVYRDVYLAAIAGGRSAIDADSIASDAYNMHSGKLQSTQRVVAVLPLDEGWRAVVLDDDGYDTSDISLNGGCTKVYEDGTSDVFELDYEGALTSVTKREDFLYVDHNDWGDPNDDDLDRWKADARKRMNIKSEEDEEEEPTAPSADAETFGRLRRRP